MSVRCNYCYTPCTREKVAMKTGLKDKIRWWLKKRESSSQINYINGYHAPIYPSNWNVQ